eukprot:4944372-Prymnesium_polylepis.2
MDADRRVRAPPARSLVSDIHQRCVVRRPHGRTSLGLSVLLEQQPQPSSAITLRFSRPDTGKPLHEHRTTLDATVKEVHAAVCAATGLKPGSMIIARGVMGQRISDSSDNMFGEGETMWQCGFSDGDEVAYMYLGDGAADLAAGPQA